MKMLNTKSLILFGLLFAVGGCQKPNEIELIDDASALEVFAVINSDTSLVRTSVDSSAILPSDEDEFSGQIVLTSMKTQSSAGTRAMVFSKVVLENRSDTVREGNIRRGYRGFHLGTVRLNGDTMLVRSRNISTLGAGFEYVKELTVFQPKLRYAWTFNSPLFGQFETSIDAPEVLQVQSPVGGSIIPRNQDLQLQWAGRGEMTIILSVVKFENTRLIARPIFKVRVKKGEGRAKLSKKVLKALPADVSTYMFTFVLLNREGKASLGRYGGKVLVQASSIHNSIVTLN
jgi:hypothetical protein